MTQKEINKAHITLKVMRDKLPFLKGHYEDLGYKFTFTSMSPGSHNYNFTISKDGDTVTGDVYDGKMSIGYSANKYKTIKSIIKKIEIEFDKKSSENQRSRRIGNVTNRFVDTLNHCGLGKTFTKDDVRAYSLPISKTVCIKGVNINIRVTDTSSYPPNFSITSSTPAGFLVAAEFIPKFLETWEVAGL